DLQRRGRGLAAVPAGLPLDIGHRNDSISLRRLRRRLQPLQGEGGDLPGLGELIRAVQAMDGNDELQAPRGHVELLETAADPESAVPAAGDVLDLAAGHRAQRGAARLQEILRRAAMRADEQAEDAGLVER